MAVKTITVTETAYGALKALKAPNESFSETLLRVAGKRSLIGFVGALSKEGAEGIEKTIMEGRKVRQISRQKRLKAIAEHLEAANGSS